MGSFGKQPLWLAVLLLVFLGDAMEVLGCLNRGGFCGNDCETTAQWEENAPGFAVRRRRLQADCDCCSGLTCDSGTCIGVDPEPVESSSTEGSTTSPDPPTPTSSPTTASTPASTSSAGTTSGMHAVAAAAVAAVALLAALVM
eukprot:jgi/Ulvmu1/7700/UM039_0004.1